VLLPFKAVAAELQIRVAWMHLDVADQPGARAAARDGFRLAQESEDLAVCSWAMAMSALLETWLGNTAAAQAYGQAAVGIAAGGPRLVQAFAQGKLARAMAAADDRDGALTALTAARSLFESAQPHEEERVPGTITDSYTDAYVLDEEAHCYRDLRQDGKALELSEQCLGLRGTDRFSRNRAFATGNRALSLARLGEVDQACESTLSLLQLARSLQSSRVARRLDAVLEGLMPFRSTRPVTELFEQVNETGIAHPGR
jgi:tetratricopeptide (TPR) repeat protein